MAPNHPPLCIAGPEWPLAGDAIDPGGHISLELFEVVVLVAAVLCCKGSGGPARRRSRVGVVVEWSALVVARVVAVADAVCKWTTQHTAQPSVSSTSWVVGTCMSSPSHQTNPRLRGYLC